MKTVMRSVNQLLRPKAGLPTEGGESECKHVLRNGGQRDGFRRGPNRATSVAIPQLVGHRSRWHASTVTFETRMEKQTVALLDSALDAVRRDLSPRAGELAEKSNAGTLTPEERIEYVEIVRLNDTLSLLKLQAENLLIARVAS